MNVFSESAGRVVALDVPGGVPAFLSVSGFPAGLVVITGFGVGQVANVQFLETLRKRVYVYAFGERMGVSELTGMFFWSRCSGSGAGATELLDYYAANTVSSRRDQIRISLGSGNSSSGVLKAFIVGVDLSARDAEKSLGFFKLSLATLPIGYGTSGSGSGGAVGVGAGSGPKLNPSLLGAFQPGLGSSLKPSLIGGFQPALR